MVANLSQNGVENRTDDPRRTRILERAMQVFLAYGFSRTTMDDIARAVEISRPALYLLFRNKADIFRAVSEMMFEESHREIRDVLAGEGPLEERLLTALDETLFKIVHLVEASPHGEELLDVNNTVAADVIVRWRQRLIECFAEAIAMDAAERKAPLESLGVSPEALAEMLFDLLDGLKARRQCGEFGPARARQFVALIGCALTPR